MPREEGGGGDAAPPTSPSRRSALLSAAAAALADPVALVVDGGTLEDVPSTVVNVRTADPVVEREGAIPTSAVHDTVAGLR